MKLLSCFAFSLFLVVNVHANSPSARAVGMGETAKVTFASVSVNGTVSANTFIGEVASFNIINSSSVSLNGTTSTNQLVVTSVTPNGAILFVTSNGTVTSTYATSTRNMIWDLPTGRLGIGTGTSTPATQLHLKNSALATESNLVAIENSNVNIGSYASLILRIGSSSDSFTTRIKGGATGVGQNNCQFYLANGNSTTEQKVLELRNYSGTIAVDVPGTLSKGGGSFKIDHPLDPEHKILQHSFVESPDMTNIYDGVVTCNSLGQATVILPDYFEALNSNFRYQLTCIGGYSPVYISQTVSNNRFVISGGSSGQVVSWQVTGIRKDRWADKHRIEVELDKNEPGYLYPDLWK